MKLQLSHLSLAFLLMFSILLTGNGQKHLVVTQPEIVTAEAGESVTIACSFTSEISSYSTTWTLECKGNVSLQNHPCFQRRVVISSSDAVQIPKNTQVPSYEMKTTITIHNLAENDSGTFCCHIKTAIGGEAGTGPGTRLEVTSRSFSAPADQKDNGTSAKMFTLYAVIVAEACVIIIVIAVVIRYRPRGFSRSEDQALQSDPSGLQYAEICRKSFPQHSKPTINVDTVTYSAVKTKKQRLTNQEHEF